jgi:hypothetical protein
MPNRIIRSDILTSERYWSVSCEAQRLFFHLTLVVDDFALFTATNFAIRAACLQGAGATPLEVDRWVGELVDSGLIVRYEARGAPYLWIPRTGWNIRAKRSKYPVTPFVFNNMAQEMQRIRLADDMHVRANAPVVVVVDVVVDVDEKEKERGGEPSARPMAERPAPADGRTVDDANARPADETAPSCQPDASAATTPRPTPADPPTAPPSDPIPVDPMLAATHIPATDPDDPGPGPDPHDPDPDKDDPAPPKPVRRATRLDPGWQPTAERIEWARELRPDLTLSMTVESFVDYWVSKPGKEGRKLDWDRTFANWVRNERARPGARTSADLARRAERLIFGDDPDPDHTED